MTDEGRSTGKIACATKPKESAGRRRYEVNRDVNGWRSEDRRYPSIPRRGISG